MCEAPNDPAQTEKESPNKKHGPTRRTVPCLINVDAKIQERPKQKSSRAEVLNDLSRLRRKGRKILAFCCGTEFRKFRK